MHFKRSKASVRAFNVGIFSFHKVSTFTESPQETMQGLSRE